MVELEMKIEKLREKLNGLMGNKEDHEYKYILDVSVELDKLINEYYILINYENNKKCTD